MFGLLAACTSAPEKRVIQPTEGKLTFAFFYTDGWQPWANMQPIVDGLENQYQDTVEFKRINASTSEGLEIFDAYSLFGHPSYLILDETGDVLWQSVGEQSAEFIESALETTLKN